MEELLATVSGVDGENPTQHTLDASPASAKQPTKTWNCLSTATGNKSLRREGCFLCFGKCQKSRGKSRGKFSRDFPATWCHKIHRLTGAPVLVDGRLRARGSGSGAPGRRSDRAPASRARSIAGGGRGGRSASEGGGGPRRAEGGSLRNGGGRRRGTSQGSRSRSF